MTAQWKYVDPSNEVVFCVHDDGGTESCLASVVLAQGITPLPADLPDHAAILREALTDIRVARIPILDALSGIAGRAQRAGNTSVALAADSAAQGLLDITQLPELLNAATYDEMKAVVLQQYRLIADGAPMEVQAPFLEVLTP